MNLREFIKTATVFQLAKGLKNKDFSSEEITSLYLERAKKLNSKNNAFISILEESAISDAKKADKLLSKGQGDDLTGIPLAVKDNICTKEVKTTCGSKMLEDFVPPYDATAISALRKKGFVLLGKTNMDEFAMGNSSQTSYFGGVKNPYDLNSVPGGSSGGSAAAVATGMCPASLGSDTGGSVRQPASFCGITGIKPTYGTVSRYGLVAFASSFDQIGVMGRTSEDCGIILNTISENDFNDSTKASRTVLDYTEKLQKFEKKVIGLPKEFFEGNINPTVRESVLEASRFFEEMGHQIKWVSLPSLKYAVAAYYLISSAEAATNLARFDGIKFGYRSKNGKTYDEIIKNTRSEGFGWEVKRRIMLGNYALSSGYYDEYYKKAVLIRGKIKSEYEQVLKECDLILTPTAHDTAYKIGSTEKDPVKMYMSDIFTVTANITGLPAVSTPCGYDQKGLPIGMSILGPAFSEADILSLTYAFEKNFKRREAEF